MDIKLLLILLLSQNTLHPKLPKIAVIYIIASPTSYVYIRSTYTSSLCQGETRTHGIYQVYCKEITIILGGLASGNIPNLSPG